MKNRTRMMIILTLFATLSGGVLSLVYLFTNPFIEANMLEEERRAIFQVVPGAENYEKKVVNDLEYFICKDGKGQVLGFAVPAKGNGYQGVIKLMIGLTPNLEEITGLQVLEQVETPGLGGRIGEKSFQDQFKGVKTSPQVEYVKNKPPDKENEIQAITGATISSRSVVSIINRKIQQLKEAI